MGAKTALLAFVDGDLRTALRKAGRPDPAEVIDRVRALHPGHEVTATGDGWLGDDTCPPDDICYVTVVDGAELYCDRRLALDVPSRLPDEVLRLAAGRRVVMHGMHSVSDWLGFAVWEDGTLVRSLSLSPDTGVVENLGEPYGFELPYWAGEHPVASTLSGDPYPLPFHPLELGEEALRALFGFVIEGDPQPDDLDPFDVRLHGFRVADPTGEEQADREAEMASLLRRMGPPRRYEMLADGTLREIIGDQR